MRLQGAGRPERHILAVAAGVRSVSSGSGEGLVVGDMCSGEPAAAAAAAAATATAAAGRFVLATRGEVGIHASVIP
jgi:hypothetical protein